MSRTAFVLLLIVIVIYACCKVCRAQEHFTDKPPQLITSTELNTNLIQSNVSTGQTNEQPLQAEAELQNTALTKIAAVVRRPRVRRIAGKGSKDGSSLVNENNSKYTNAKFGITSEEGRNVQAVTYEMNTVSKLEGFKLITEFLQQCLKKVPECIKEESEPLDGLSVYNNIKPSEDIMFRQKATTTKTIQADVILGFYPVSKIIRIKLDSPFYISPQYMITSNSSQFSSKSGDQDNLLSKFNEQRFLVEFISRIDAANIDFIGDKQTLLMYIYDLVTKNYDVVEIREDNNAKGLFNVILYE